MTEHRNFGVTEARVGLTLITCLLATLGYVIIARMSDSPRPTVATPSLPTYSEADGVRTALGAEPSQPAEHQTSYAPQWLEPQPIHSDGAITR